MAAGGVCSCMVQQLEQRGWQLKSQHGCPVHERQVREIGKRSRDEIRRNEWNTRLGGYGIAELN